MSLKVGEHLPEFSLKDQHGNWFHSADFLGKKPLVIFFYPKDYTPGCIAEVCSFRDSFEDFTDLGAEVVGISSDSEVSHSKFAKSYRLPFKLLADQRKKVRKIFRVENRFFNLLPGRETFVANKEGILIMAFNSALASNHVKKAIAALQNEE